MGANNSTTPAAYMSALAVFSTQEQKHLETMFETICQTTVEKDHAPVSRKRKHREHVFDCEQLQACTPTLPNRLSENVFDYMLFVLPSDGKKKEVVTHHDFVVALSHILKGTASERARLVSFLAMGNAEDVNTTMLVKLMEDLMEAYQKTAETQNELHTWKLSNQAGVIDIFNSELLQQIAPTGPDGRLTESTFTEADVEKWISGCAWVHHILDYVFKPAFPVQGEDAPTNTLIPYCQGAPWDEMSTILDLPSLLLVANALPAACRTPWRLLFEETLHGESFSTLFKQITHRGPCVIVVRDCYGNIFGGFTGVSLSPGPKFVGNESCFLFNLLPNMQIYNATGLNKNYVYLNKGQETLPNGLGMGGQFGFFGLWLDADYGRGHSQAAPTNTTYGSPRLSAAPYFTIDRLEVWGVGTEPRDEEPPPQKSPELKLADLIGKSSRVKSAGLKWKKNAKAKAQDPNDPKLRLFDYLQISMEEADPTVSILDKDSSAKAMLNMINRGMASEGLREPAPTTQSPRKPTADPTEKKANIPS